MEAVGFFAEFSGSGPSLVGRMGPPYAWQEHIARYLANGTVVWVVPEVVEDPFLGGESAGTRSVRTDGEWVWPGELAHLVRRHGVEVPEVFVEHMRSHDWTPPPVDRGTRLRAGELEPPR